MRSRINAFFDWFLHAADREREAYLSKAVDLTDLECRMRNWEDRPHIFG